MFIMNKNAAPLIIGLDDGVIIFLNDFDFIKE